MAPVTQFDTVAEGARFPGAGIAVAGSAAIAGAAATGAVMGTGVGVVREMRAQKCATFLETESG
jgi:hypothetical protein